MLDLFLRLIVMSKVSNGQNQQVPQLKFFLTMLKHHETLDWRHGREFKLWPLQFIKSGIK